MEQKSWRINYIFYTRDVELFLNVLYNFSTISQLLSISTTSTSLITHKID